MNSWPLCLHARGPHAGHTQTRAHASRCVTVERASTGVCVHHARVSWISKQPGIICPSRAKATCARSCTFCTRPTLRSNFPVALHARLGSEAHGIPVHGSPFETFSMVRRTKCCHGDKALAPTKFQPDGRKLNRASLKFRKSAGSTVSIV